MATSYQTASIRLVTQRNGSQNISCTARTIHVYHSKIIKQTRFMPHARHILDEPNYNLDTKNEGNQRNVLQLFLQFCNSYITQMRNSLRPSQTCSSKCSHTVKMTRIDFSSEIQGIKYKINSPHKYNIQNMD